MEKPEYIYKVVIVVGSDGQVQRNLFKNKVSSITDKHYIIPKNLHNGRALHVDKPLLGDDQGGEVNRSVTFGFAYATTWCYEHAIKKTSERLKTILINSIEEEIHKMNNMLQFLKEKEPVVTERDTAEYG